MMNPGLIASVRLDVDVTTDGDRHIARVPSLGLCTYGATLKDSVSRLGTAATMLFDELERSMTSDAIFAKLVSAEGVHVSTETRPLEPRIIERVTLTPQGEGLRFAGVA